MDLNPRQHRYVHVEDPNEFVIILDKVLAKTSKASDYCKKAAMHLQEFQVLPCGMFLGGLAKKDIEEPQEALEVASTLKDNQFIVQSEEQERHLQNLTLCAMLLAMGEGSVMMTPEIVHEATVGLCIMAQLEILYREGKIILYRDQMSVFERPGVNKPLFVSKIIPKG